VPDAYPVREARAHEPSVRIVDGWAVMPATQWVAYSTLSGSFFLALQEIAERPELAAEISETCLAQLHEAATPPEPERPFHDV